MVTRSMALHSLRTIALIVSCLLVGACATEPRVMTFDMPDNTASRDNMWPAPPAKARYAYIGDLTGERNFHNTTDQASSSAQSIWEFIAGIVGNEYQPMILKRPQSVVTDAEGNIFVTDVGQQAVVSFQPATGVMDIWFNADRAVPFVTPVGITLSNRGSLFITDAEHKEVFELTIKGEPVSRFGKGVLQRPTGIAQDPVTGTIYVADTQADNIVLFDSDGRLIDTIGSAGEAPGLFNAPTHLAFQHNSLYVSDTLNARIQLFDTQGDLISSIGERGINRGQFSRPKGIASDSEGNIYAIESYYDHLLVFDSQGRFLLPIGGTGAEAGHFYLPAGIWIDQQDRLYIADMMNGRIAIFQYLGSGND
ncbi:6-bladed beta-propeller [Aestuariirhabdus sp. LZHN29]|uniref:6-bladed beta-propeller n=1 Tax=Aestuariirhabdus sp. LZHN29 TaxID=3417462 RepID=UPI003CF272EA